MLALILVVLAFVLFLLAAVPVPSRFNLVAAGLAAYVLSQLVGRMMTP